MELSERRIRTRLLTAQRAEVLFGERQGPLLRDVPGEGDDRVIRRVEFVFVALEVGLRDFVDDFFRADRVPTEGAVAEHHLFEVPARAVHGRVFVHAFFFDDHAALLVDLVRREAGVQEHVAQDVARQFGLRVRDLHVVAGVFLARERVEVAADAFDGRADLLGVHVFLAALEEHVFQEVADAALGVRFVARTRAAEDEDRDGFRAVDRGGEDAEAGLEGVERVHGAARKVITRGARAGAWRRRRRARWRRCRRSRRPWGGRCPAWR